MKAIRITETGGPEVLQFVDVPDPIPGPGQALVELKAIGVNYTDVYTRAGVNPPKLPAIPGVEGAGVVIEVGEGVYAWFLGPSYETPAEVEMARRLGADLIGQGLRNPRAGRGLDHQVLDLEIANRIR